MDERDLYKVKILKRRDTPPHDCLRLGVSVGNGSHEGAKLEALIDWAAARFKFVNIMVADSLQRHNIMAETGVDEAQALAMAMRAGDEWIERNGAILARLPAHRLYRFDHFRMNPDFADISRLLHGLYDRNLRFRALIDGDVHAYWERRVARGEAQGMDAEIFMRHSRNYIIEELAVMKIFHEECPGIEVYPGKFIRAVTAPERQMVDGLPESLKTYPMIEVDFVRNKGAAHAHGGGTAA